MSIHQYKSSSIVRRLSPLALVALLLVLCLLPTACDDDGPTGPTAPTDYPLYFCDIEGTPQLFKLYPFAERIDSAVIPWNAREGITVSADGRRLYLADRNQISVIDAENYSLITQLPYQPEGPVAVSPDNKLLAIANNGLHILSTTDYRVVFSDTGRLYHCAFSSDSKTLYCARNNTQYLYRLDLSTEPYTSSSIFFDYGYPIHVIPTPDESKLILYLGAGYATSIFAVYDIARDSTVFGEYLVPGYGHIALTRDGRYAFYTSPGRSGTDPPGPPIIGVFDIGANSIDTVIEDVNFFSDSTWAAWPNRMAVTPDNQFLGILGGSLGLRVVYLYDIENRSLVYREAWGGSDHIFNNISAQLHTNSMK